MYYWVWIAVLYFLLEKLVYQRLLYTYRVNYRKWKGETAETKTPGTDWFLFETCGKEDKESRHNNKSVGNRRRTRSVLSQSNVMLTRSVSLAPAGRFYEYYWVSQPWWWNIERERERQKEIGQTEGDMKESKKKKEKPGVSRCYSPCAILLFPSQLEEPTCLHRWLRSSLRCLGLLHFVIFFRLFLLSLAAAL